MRILYNNSNDDSLAVVIVKKVFIVAAVVAIIPMIATYNDNDNDNNNNGIVHTVHGFSPILESAASISAATMIDIVTAKATAIATVSPPSQEFQMPSLPPILLPPPGAAVVSPTVIMNTGRTVIPCMFDNDAIISIGLSSSTIIGTTATSIVADNNILVLWTARILSAFLTYFGFVAFTDRPRGVLNVPLIPMHDDTNNDDDCCLRVGTSNVSGAGLGLFVTESLSKGTILGTYPGVLIPLPQHSSSNKIRQHPEMTEYVWRFTDNQFIIDPTNHQTGALDDYCIGGNPSQPLSVPFFNVLDSSFFSVLHPVSTALCRINEPPKGYDVNVVTEEDLQSRTVVFTLERDVYAGEEIFIDYGLTYDRSKYQ